MNWADHLLLGLLGLLLAQGVVGAWMARRGKGRGFLVPGAEDSYSLTIGVQWGLTAILVLVWGLYRRPWSDLGLGWPGNWEFVLSSAVFLILVPPLMRLRTRLLGSAEKQDDLLDQTAHLQGVMPRTAEELQQFKVLCLTAGICEELLFRGFLLAYLGDFMPLGWAVGVAALLFGLSHAYQGWRGVLQTTLVAAAAGGLYLWIGSLWLVMAIHAWVDWNSGLLVYRASLARRARGSWR